MTEEVFQIACTRLIRREFRLLAPYYIHVANENIRDVRLDIEKGAIIGFPDVFVFYACRGFRGFMCELKVGRNGLRRAQLRVLREYRRRGFYCCVCYDLDEFRKHLTWYYGNDNTLQEASASGETLKQRAIGRIVSLYHRLLRRD